MLLNKPRPLVNPADLPAANQRKAETIIRRRLYAWEDDCVRTLYRLYGKAYQDIEATATRLARGIDQLRYDSAGVQWRDQLTAYTRQRIGKLQADVAYEAYRYSVTAYYAGWLMRAWMLTQTTSGDVRAIPPNATDAHRQVLQPHLREQVDSQLLYNLLGDEWRKAYAPHMNTLLQTITTGLNATIQNREGMQVGMKRVADALGIMIDRRRTTIPNVRANFNRVDAITRTALMDSANRGSLDLYQRNAGLVTGIQFLAANDGKVCPVCRGLNGTVWALGDLSARIPPRDTHPRCRCTILSVINPDYAHPPATPIRTGLTDWLVGLGVEWMLAEFLKPKESRRIIDEYGFESEMEGEFF